MKDASITLVLLGLFGVAFSACAEGDHPQFGNGSSNANAGASGGGVGGAGGSGGAGGATCAPTCTADSDCALTCAPAPAGSSNCCDKMNGMCFTSDQATCPAPPVGTGGAGGTGGTMY